MTATTIITKPEQNNNKIESDEEKEAEYHIGMAYTKRKNNIKKKKQRRISAQRTQPNS